MTRVWGRMPSWETKTGERLYPILSRGARANSNDPGGAMGADATYQAWERRDPFESKNGQRLYPLYAPAYEGQCDHLWVFDQEVDPNDYEVEHGLLAHRVAFLDWRGRTVSYVETEPSWQGQGIAREMLRLAREVKPGLRHAPCSQRSEFGEAFVRATDYDARCQGVCGNGCRNPLPDEPAESIRALSLWARIKGALGL